MKTDLFSYPTPFTPPTTEEDELSVLRLIRSRRVGATTFHKLMTEHRSAQAALQALPQMAQAAGLPDYAPCPMTDARAEMAAGRKAGARLLCFGQPHYPPFLSRCEDAPPVLWTLGDRALMSRPAIAIVGARNASSLGLRMARSLARDLGEAGFVIVSGLARGIDAAAHAAALDTGTIAVQAGGIDTVYPRENTDLARDIAEKGLRLAENPPGLNPQARHFPQRNRIISGLVRAVIVIEAAHRSGSLITARTALDQGREVLAVPGHPMDARAAGCNMLIRDGAVLIRDAADVIAAIGEATSEPDTAAARQPRTRSPVRSPAAPDTTQPDMNPLDMRTPDTAAARILSALGPSPVTEDRVIRDLQIPAHVFAQEITMMEMDGLIERHPGGMISRIS